MGKTLNFIVANWIIVCDDNFNIIKNGAIVFDKAIIAIDTQENILKQYPSFTSKEIKKNTVLMPGLINPHIHLEFSANKTTLEYGNFLSWLYSVIENRETLIEKATPLLIDDTLHKVLKSGTTTIGAISSYGFDLQSCIDTPINTVYFTEAIGSKADMIDTLLLDFKEKLQNAITQKSKAFIPAIAIHSPYSTHPFLVREILNIAKKHNMAISAHYMESKEENDWLNYSTGKFSTFFKNLLNQTKSNIKPIEFLRLFKNTKNISFTHCTRANKLELEEINKLNATIIHCPNSNRLLTNDRLNIDFTEGIDLAIGTDGLSSNYSVDLFDELKSAFFMYNHILPHQLAKRLLISATKNGAKALGLNKGRLSIGKDADMLLLELDDEISTSDNLAIAIILQHFQIKNIFIDGKDINIL